MPTSNATISMRMFLQLKTTTEAPKHVFYWKFLPASKWAFSIRKAAVAASFCEKCPHEWFHLTPGKAEAECESRGQGDSISFMPGEIRVTFNASALDQVNC